MLCVVKYNQSISPQNNGYSRTLVVLLLQANVAKLTRNKMNWPDIVPAAVSLRL